MPDANPITTTNGQRSAFKPLVFAAGIIGTLRYSVAGMTLFGTTVPAFDATGFAALLGALSALYCGRHATKSWERVRTQRRQEAADAK